MGKCQWLAPRLAILQSDLKISQLVRRISEPLTDPNGLYKAFSSIGLIPFSGVFFIPRARRYLILIPKLLQIEWQMVERLEPKY